MGDISLTNQEAFEWRKEMERKQRSLLGKDESDQYLAGLQEKFSKVCINFLRWPSVATMSLL